MSNLALSPSDTIKPWQVMAAGMAAMLLTVGIARFAYTPMLPLMQAQTGMSPFAGGLLATVNYAGYMTGALLASTISDARRRYLVYRVGLIAGVIGTLGMGLTTHVWAWLLLRYIAGIGGASGMLLASGMVLAFLVRHGRRPGDRTCPGRDAARPGGRCGGRNWGCISSGWPSASSSRARW